MKKIILVCLISVAFLNVKAQDAKTLSNDLGKLKKEGKLNGDESFENPNATINPLQITSFSTKRGSHGNNSSMSSTACNCWIPRDNTFQVVPFDGSGGSGGPGVAPTYANDDWSTSGITLPFNFCLYGTNMGTGTQQLFINNNGNVSFGGAYSTFSAVAFPSSTYTMVAPFWADVETTNPGSGFVYYQLTATHLIVQWDSVTCYQSTPGSNSLKNTFQLIITNGTDPILSGGNNVSFCYGDMQWTTGDASQGTNGFGGTPATVGINKGSGGSYVQVSLFDNNGSTFTNPAGSPASGVNWLDYKSFYFNSCGSATNLPPLSTAGGSSCGGDTLTICAAGDTLTQLISFTGPEPTQSVSLNASAPTIGSGFSILSSTVGTTGSLIFQVASGGLTPGLYNVSVTGTDNGTPIQSTTLNYVIRILNAPIPNPTITVNPNITCGNTPAIITLTNASSYDSYVWSTGSTTYSTSVLATSTVQVTVTKNGCSKTGSVIANFYPKPVVGITGVVSYCPPSTSTILTATTSAGSFTYNWDNGTASTSTLQATGANAPGTPHSVVVTDAHGCKDSVSVNVIGGTVPTLTITSKGSLCAGVDTLIASITNASSYTWTPGVGSSTNTYTVSLSGVYHLNLSINNCPVSASYSLSPPITPTVSYTGITSICSGNSTHIAVNALPAGTYSYTWYNGNTPVGTGNTQNINTIGTYSIVAINNNTQCVGTTSFTVNNYPNPTASIHDLSGLSTYCKNHGDTLTANVNGINPPYSYTWLPGGTSGLNDSVYYATPPTNAALFTYTVVVKDSKGCIDTTTIPLKQSNPHLVIASPSICPGYSVPVTANGSGTAPLTYTWTNNVNSTVFIGKKDIISVPGNYTVSMTDFYGCPATATLTVGQNPVPQANFNYAPTSVEAGLPITFTDASTVATGSVSAWLWTFGDTDSARVSAPIHTYNSGGTYSVTLIVASDKGCLATVTKIIDIQYIIIAPNIITPNGDGINEILSFKNLEYFKNNKLQIFNRWGTRLYQDNDYKNNWSGKDLSDGTYFYILEIPEKHKTLNGFFESIK